MLAWLHKRRNRNRTFAARGERVSAYRAIYRDRLVSSIAVALQSNGGVYKRIDEMRELFELMAIRDPEGVRFLDKHSEIRSWLECEDNFLCQLAEVARQMEIDEMEMEHDYPLLHPRPSWVRPRPDYFNRNKD